MGVVYRAQDPAINRTVAVKSIRLAELSGPSELARLRDRLFREAQSAGKLSHPGIVTIYDIAEQDGFEYIFMEYVAGPTLEHVLNSGRNLDTEFVLGLFRQTAAALDYAHRKEIVHRDVKPGNIMIADDGTVKISDFGVAKMASHDMTQAGMLMGTPNYMSPEQVEGRPVDGRADQFALAVVAYQVLTGEKPFVSESLPRLFFKISSEAAPPAHRLNPTLSPEIDAVLRRGLAKRAEDRFETCTQFAAALESACRACPGWTPIAPGGAASGPTVMTLDKRAPIVPARPSPRATPSAQPRPSKVKSVFAALSGAVLAMALGVVGFWLFATRGRVESVAVPPPVEQTVKPEPVGPPVEAASEPVPEPVAPEPPKPEPVKIKPKAEAKPKPKPEEMTGEFIVPVNTMPSGAKITIDGKRSCVSPCSMPLALGRHVVLAVLAGYKDGVKIIEVPRERAVSIEMPRPLGQIQIGSTPGGAAIAIDGADTGQKTPARLTLSAGEHQVSVAIGRQKKSYSVVIKDGAMHSFEADLTEQ